MKLPAWFTSKHAFALPFTLIVLGFVARLLPHPANVAPIGAIALFSGLYLTNRWSILAPFVGLLLSDLIIGFYDIRMMAGVYLGFFIMWGIGHLLRTRKTVVNIIGSMLAGSISFFLITNATVWAFGTMYPHTFQGLIESYTMAIPFFRNSVIGDLFFGTLLIGIYEIISSVTTEKAIKSSTP